MSDDRDFATRAPAVLAVTSIFIAFSTVFVALRLVSRFAIVRKVGLDDYFIILAWVGERSPIGLDSGVVAFQLPDPWVRCLAGGLVLIKPIVKQVLAFGLSFSICYGTGYGLGRHERRVPEEWQDNLNESQYAFSVIYVSLHSLNQMSTRLCTALTVRLESRLDGHQDFYPRLLLGIGQVAKDLPLGNNCDSRRCQCCWSRLDSTQHLPMSAHRCRF